MNKIKASHHHKHLLYIGLALALLACWWMGWRDFDPNIAQELVRENIRSSIRGLIQVSIQYLVPIAILVFFTSEIFNGIPLGQDQDET